MKVLIYVSTRYRLLDYIDDHKNTDNAWVHGTCVAFELNFEVDFDTSEEMQNNELLCTLNGSPGGVASWITITGTCLLSL